MPQSWYPLALLACPLGMGLMMWMMMRGNKDGQTRDPSSEQRAELERMQAEIDQLRADSRRQHVEHVPQDS